MIQDQESYWYDRKKNDPKNPANKLGLTTDPDASFEEKILKLNKARFISKPNP